MTYDKSQTIKAFLEATAAKQPTPGGGSVAALAGALAAAMGEMVLNYSIGKRELVAYQDDLQDGLAELHRARQVLLELMLEDQAAFATLTQARKMPASDSQRTSRIEDALLICIRIPQAIGLTAAAMLRICNRLAEQVNKYLLSDLAVCAELSMATMRCAAYNVRVNLADVEDSNERSKIQSALSRQITEAAKLMQSIIPRIWARVEQP